METQDVGNWVVAVLVAAAIVAMLALARGTADHQRSALPLPTVATATA